MGNIDSFEGSKNFSFLESKDFKKELEKMHNPDKNLIHINIDSDFLKMKPEVFGQEYISGISAISLTKGSRYIEFEVIFDNLKREASEILSEEYKNVYSTMNELNFLIPILNTEKTISELEKNFLRLEKFFTLNPDSFNFLGFHDDVKESSNKGILSILGGNNETNIDDLKITDLDNPGKPILNRENQKEIEQLFIILSSIDDFKAVGGKLPKGYLLQGVPGVGKTMLFKSMAYEYKNQCDFYTFNLNDFDSEYVSVAPKKLAAILSEIKQKSQESGKQAIILIDEFDDFGGKKKESLNYQNKLTNVFLRFLDGMSEMDSVTFLCSTNSNKEDFEDSLLRPGRIEGNIIIEKPDFLSRRKIFSQVISKGNRERIINPNLDVNLLAKITNGLTGADIEKLINDIIQINFVKRRIKQDNNIMINTEDIINEIKNGKKQFELNNINRIIESHGIVTDKAKKILNNKEKANKIGLKIIK